MKAALFLASVVGGTIVNTAYGPVNGNQLPGGAREFLGMPFASAKRFEAPIVRTAKFPQSPFDATYFGPACLQTLTANTTYGVEDCLVMNVWSPKDATKDSNLPVLVYIYGGDNDFGEAEPYNSSQLSVDQNIVVASFNYRVGPYGFLAFQEQLDRTNSTGNFALLDMQAALRWVQQNIRSFGGDPSQVAIFGQSSGAGNVELQTVLPGSKGLFQAAISQSGGLYVDSLKSGLETTATMAKRLNCSKRGYTSTLKCLKETDADQIIFAQAVQCVTPNDCSGLDFGPIVDGGILPENPRLLVQKGLLNDVSILYGANTNDSNLGPSSEYSKAYPLNQSSYERMVRNMFASSAAADSALQYYPSKPDPQNNGPALGWLLSDQTLCGVKRTAKLYANAPRRGRGKTFIYRYNYWFQSNKICTAVPNYHAPELGSLHQDEVTFVFGQPIKMNLGYTNCSVPGWSGYDPSCLDCVFDKKEAAFSKTMGFFWSNMASTGNPNFRKDKNYTAVNFPEYSPESEMNILLQPVKAPYTPDTMIKEAGMG